jgi:hypothetical protein
MKTKLSALEELRIEKSKLAEACAEDKKRLLQDVDYAKSNWGRLLAGSFFSSTKNGISDAFALVSGKSNSADSPSFNLRQTLLSATPLVWKFIQPMLIRMLLRKVKSIFTRKKRK